MRKLVLHTFVAGGADTEWARADQIRFSWLVEREGFRERLDLCMISAREREANAEAKALAQRLSGELAVDAQHQRVNHMVFPQIYVEVDPNDLPPPSSAIRSAMLRMARDPSLVSRDVMPDAKMDGEIESITSTDDSLVVVVRDTEGTCCRHVYPQGSVTVAGMEVGTVVAKGDVLATFLPERNYVLASDVVQVAGTRLALWGRICLQSLCRQGVGGVTLAPAWAVAVIPERPALWADMRNVPEWQMATYAHLDELDFSTQEGVLKVSLLDSTPERGRQRYFAWRQQQRRARSGGRELLGGREPWKNFRMVREAFVHNPAEGVLMMGGVLETGDGRRRNLVTHDRDLTLRHDEVKVFRRARVSSDDVKSSTNVKLATPTTVGPDGELRVDLPRLAESERMVEFGRPQSPALPS